MSLPIPVVGVEAGPEYATDVNNCLGIIDDHNHAPGSGVQIDPTGLNINADLEINSNNLVEVRSVRLEEQIAPIGGASDLGCVYNSDGDLYFNDALGNQIQITANGAVAGTPGSIANLVAPASASYVAANETFVWESDTSTPANLDAGSVIVRKVTANSAGIEIAAPSALASDYTVTLMAAAPGATSFLGMDSSGNLSALAAASQGLTLSMLELAVQRALNPAGSILAYGGAAAPSGYLMCDGSSVVRATYPDLFTAIGTAYGAADGTHFNVPDLRGKFLRGVTGGSANDPDAASRTAQATGGNTGNNVGSVQGHAFQTHQHTLNTGRNAQIAGTDGIPRDSNNQSGGVPVNPTNTAAASGATAQASADETRPINVYVNFIIKV